MSFGHGDNYLELEKARLQERRDKLVAEVDAVRAARLPGHKSLVQRLLQRLRPHRQEAGDDSRSSYGTVDNPGR